MSRFRFGITLAGLALLVPGLLFAQAGSVSGQVTNAETGEPLRAARVGIVGTNIETLTNAEGRYTITGPVGAQTLRVLLLGYAQHTQPVTIQAGFTATANVALTQSAIRLEGVVINSVSGREQRQRELGTNIGAIDLSELNLTPITSVSDILSARTEGVYLQDVNGTTGTSQRIRIRGANSLSLSNDPLIYVDGIQVDASSTLSLGVGGQEASRLNDINPSDIESIEIVKGPAAAALYGTAAANGVLLITTKRGRAGPTEWNFFAEAGAVEDRTDYPANYMAYQVIGNASASLFDPATGNFNSTDFRRCPNRDAAAGLCTQDDVAIFNTLKDARTTPFSVGDRQRVGISVRGGTDRVRFYVSGERENEQGVIQYNLQNKVSVRANLDAAVSDKFDLSVSSGYTQVSSEFPNNDNSIFSPILAGLLGEGYFIPESAKPTTGRGANPGVHRGNYGFGFNQWDNANWITNDEVDRITLSGTAQFRPLNWLSLNASGGVDLIDGHTHRTLQPNLLPIAASFTPGHRSSDRKNDFTYTFNSSAIASFQPFRNIVSTTTVGWTYNESKTERTECFGAGIVQGTSSCGTTSTLFSVDEDFSRVKTVGAFVSTEIAWRDRVFVSGAFRGDDNSAFGTDFGFVTYPSAMVSWVIGEEDWFPQSSLVSALRLRAAYGESGLRPGFRDAVTLFAPVTVARGGGDVPGITVSTTGNETLKPEKSREIELGFDAALFNDRVGIDFTYFDKRSQDALVERDLPPSFGVAATRFENLGEIKNAGTETAIRITPIDKREFGVRLFGTVTTLSNEVIDLGEGVEDIVFNRGLQRHAEGHPAGSFFQQEISWNDADGNGLLTNAEVTVDTVESFIGPSLPTWQTTVGAELRLFDWLIVSTLLEWRGGNYQGNDSEAFRCGFRSTRGCPAVGNPDASLEEQARYIADRFLASAYGFVEKANFGKWREMSVTLRAPRSWPQLDGLSVTFAGRNLATWTDYTGLDPETVEGGGNVNFSQSEFNTQPPIRHLMVRVNYTIR